jgi:hypothetical protein
MSIRRIIASLTTIAGVLSCAAPALAQAGQRGFSVVLVLGETQGSAGGESTLPPPAVRKALTDVKDFLPYKSYRVLETGWVAGSKGGTTRLRGGDDQEYDVKIVADELYPNPIKPREGMLNVVFELQEPGAPASSSEEFARSMAVNGMEQQRANAQANMNRVGENEKKQLREEIARLDKSIRMARARRLIDSRFEMKIGETVVVGTSKLGGGEKGLVVLLTAVPSGAK